MNINEAIVKYGTEAVLHYRVVAGLSHDDEVPEVYLGGIIAGGIHSEMNENARVERYYMAIARELGVAVDASVIERFGGNRADVAIYRKDVPVAIIELKVFADFQSASKIVADRDKMRKFTDLCPMETYLGVLVTDAQNGQTCADRVRTLEGALGHKFDVIGGAQPSVGGDWHWCFVSVRTNSHTSA